MKTKKMINMTIRDDKDRLVDWWNIEMNKVNDLEDIEKVAIEHIYEVDDFIGREHKNLHTELTTMTVRA